MEAVASASLIQRGTEQSIYLISTLVCMCTELRPNRTIHPGSLIFFFCHRVYIYIYIIGIFKRLFLLTWSLKYPYIYIYTSQKQLKPKTLSKLKILYCNHRDNAVCSSHDLMTINSYWMSFQHCSNVLMLKFILVE